MTSEKIEEPTGFGWAPYKVNMALKKTRLALNFQWCITVLQFKTL